MRSRILLLAGLTVVASACTSSADHGPTLEPSVTPPGTTSTSPVAPSQPAAASSSVTQTPSATPTAIPPLSPQARADGLIDVRSVVPDAVIDLRYATINNFTHVRLYPKDARCLVHESMAPGLKAAARKLRATGDVLVFWDCYRPHAVQVRMFQVVPDPDWVARPTAYATSHESGRSVDVTLARAAVRVRCASGTRIQGHCLLAMGTRFDDFTPRATAYATDGVSKTAQADRALLRDAMASGGLRVYAGEWWHFDGPGSLDPRPILTAPVD